MRAVRSFHDAKFATVLRGHRMRRSPRSVRRDPGQSRKRSWRSRKIRKDDAEARWSHRPRSRNGGHNASDKGLVPRATCDAKNRRIGRELAATTILENTM